MHLSWQSEANKMKDSYDFSKGKRGAVIQAKVAKIRDELSLYAQVANINLLRPIKSEGSYERVLEEVDELAPRTNRSKEEDDYLMVLSLLLQQYEKKYHAIK
jgi:hypothetical protein